MNLKITIHLFLFCIFCTISSCLLYGTKETDPALVPEFKWAVLLSAPKFYRASIEFGVFHGAETEIASGTLFHGWGEVGPGMIVMAEPRTLPDSAYATWHSYAEGMYYKASFKLDTAKIKECLKKNKYGFETDLCCAVAPGGVAVVWVISFTDRQESGIYNRVYTEVARSIGMVTKTESEGYKKRLRPSELYWLDMHGLSLGSWDASPEKYLWKPIVLSPEAGYLHSFHIQIYYMNGNGELIDNWLLDKPGKTDSAVFTKYPTHLWSSIHNDTTGLSLRGLPCLIEVGLGYKNGEGVMASVILPKLKIDAAFKTKKYDRIIFEVHKNHTLTAWLYGNNNAKINLGKTEILNEEWEENINHPKKNK